MLDLADFVHLPEVDTLVAELVADGPGLYVVAGLDPRTPTHAGFLPSGRGTLFRILMRMMLHHTPDAPCIVIAEDQHVVRMSRSDRKRASLFAVRPPYTYASRIADAVQHKPGVLVIDRLHSENARAALDAAKAGVRVLSQLDTVFTGGAVARHLLDLGASMSQTAHLRWVVAVQRLPTLCPHCKQPVTLTPVQHAQLHAWKPGSASQAEPTFYTAGRCTNCDNSGRYGDVMVLDVFRAGGGAASVIEQPSALPAREYAWRLAQRGDLALEDVQHFEAQQFYRTYNLLTASEHALSETNQALERKIAELEAAHTVMEQRTRAVISLQDISQSLISSADLDDLARQVCRHARELCGADRAILYLLRDARIAEILAMTGWGAETPQAKVSADTVCSPDAHLEPEPFNQWPPGIPDTGRRDEQRRLRAGLRVPLVSQGERVGVMIVHSTHKNRFDPGEIALLQAFVNQAALAIQRASLIETLRAKIDQLEAAQVELAQKERIERELELARQVQQSVLPHTFPHIPGYQFAAHNEPARQVGGDFYDVIMLDETHFGVAIADVSGKGMPAALYMALTRSLLLAESRRAGSEVAPAAVLASVNGLLMELGEPNMFVTVFYGIVDRAARRLTYARAGHDRPVLLRGSSADELPGKGAALGLFDTRMLHLDELTLDLASGDQLVLYTDGMTDVADPAGALFSREQFYTVLRRHADRPPEALCRAVFADLAAYQQSAAQYDDMTMLVLTVE